MSVYISLLRGINVSGQKIIKMVDLKSHFESCGFTNVQTYIQSGNVVFCSDIKSRLKIKERIENKIMEVYNFSVPTFVLTQSKIEEAIIGNPFNSSKIDFSKVSVTFLDTVPKNNSIENIENFQGKNEEFVISENVIYLYCPDGFGKTKLRNNFFEKKMKVTATSRNWKTTNKLLEISNETKCDK
jgi:uncharacterized protein (DUF1697 family)